MTRGALWLGTTRVLVNVVGFLGILLLARFLAPADFGLVAVATTVLVILTSITELSLSNALIHHADPTDRHLDVAWTLNVARSMLISAVLALLAYPLATLYDDERLAPIFFVLAGAALATGLVSPRTALMQRDLVFWQEFAVNVSQKIAGFAVSVAIAIAFQTYWAIVCGYVASQLTTVVASYLIAPYRPRFRLAGLKELMSFSIWLSFAQVINTLNWRSDQLIIGYVLGKAPLGTYNFGDTVAGLPTRELSGAIAQTLFPAFARLRATPDRLPAAYQSSQTLLCALALPAGFGLALVADPFVRLLLGDRWEEAILVIQILAGAIAIQTFSSALQPLAMALGETRTLFLRDLLTISFRLPAIVIGMLLAGLPGILVARATVSVLGTLYGMVLVRRFLNVSVSAQFAANRRTMLGTVLMIAAVGAAHLTLLPALGEDRYLVEMIVVILIGATTFLGTVLVAWWIEGRPEGPESVAVGFAAALRTRLAKYRRGHAASGPVSPD